MQILQITIDLHYCP